MLFYFLKFSWIIFHFFQFFLIQFFSFLKPVEGFEDIYGFAWPWSTSLALFKVNIEGHAESKSRHDIIVGRCTAGPPFASWTAVLQTLISTSSLAFALYGKKKRIAQMKYIVIMIECSKIITCRISEHYPFYSHFLW